MKKTILVVSFLLLASITGIGQAGADTEFQKGWTLLAQLHSGMVTGFKSSKPDLFVGGIGLHPQYTVAPRLLRAGIQADAVYSAQKISLIAGPTLALKLKTFATNFGGLANVHLLANAGWGTNKQQLIGTGLGIELLNKVHLGITAKRDYRLNSWWFQSYVGIKLNKVKFTKQPYE